jgi:hypothetical protein
MTRVRTIDVVAAFLFGMAGLIVGPVRAEEFAGPETCAACHAQEYADWRGSVHSQALSPHFKKIWKESGSKASCLACHVTGLEKGTSHYAFAGVTCESCHGAMAAGHPGEAKMPIPLSSEMCKSCHQKTFKEWAISRHGQKNIRCFDCHNVHKQGLRAGGGDALCGSCHPGRLKDFAHATHKTEGLHCATCHMPASADRADAMEGTGAAGHSLAVGAEVCARCHEETVHKSSRIQSLREEVSQFQHQVAISGGKTAFDLQEENKNLEWQLKRAQASGWLSAILGLLAGLGLGWLACWYLLHRKK